MYFIRETKRNVIIPFKLINNLIVIPIKINNSKIYYFILDSGVRTPIITELDYNDSIKLNYLRKQKIHGLGKGDPLEVYFSTHNDFSIFNIIHSNLNAYFLAENVFHLSAKMGTQINGLIGYDIFKNFIVKIDYAGKKLILYNPALYSQKKNRRWTTLPLEINNKKAYLRTVIEQEDGSKIPVKLLLDTGSSLALWLSVESDSLLKLPSKYKETFLGKGLNGEIYGKKSRIKSVYIGKYKLTNPTASFPDSSSVLNTIKKDNRNGSLGAEILRRFTVIIDYYNKEISFLPNHNLHDEFKYDRSGIEIYVPYPGLPFYVIHRIRKDSPADKAGLKKGDQILSINSNKNINLTLNQIHGILRRKDGYKIKMKVQRDNEVIEAQFKLKKDL